MNNDILTALKNVKKGIMIEVPTNDGNAVVIKKAGVNKYKVTDKLGLKKPVHLNYLAVKELMGKFNHIYEKRRLN